MLSDLRYAFRQLLKNPVSQLRPCSPRHGLGLTLLGVAVGLAGPFALTRVLRNYLYEVGPVDPITFAAVALLLVMVALLACLIPARRGRT